MPVLVQTHPVRESAIRSALDEIDRLPDVTAETRLVRIEEDLVAPLPLDVRDEADTAAVLFVRGIVETLPRRKGAARAPRALFQRPGRGGPGEGRPVGGGLVRDV